MYGKQPTPCVGLSFGVDRIFTILDAQRKKKSSSELTNEVDVYITAAGGKDDGGLLLERMSVARQLWDAGIRAEYAAKVKPRLHQQLNASWGMPLAVVLGQNELAASQVRLRAGRDSGDKETGQKDRGRLVSREDLVDEVRKMLSAIALE